MIATVELLPACGVDEPVVGAEVDDEAARAGGFELGGDLAGGTVRQCQKNDVVAGEVFCGGVEELHVGVPAQVRLVLTEQRAGVGVGGKGANVELGVACGKTEHLSPGIAGGARDGDRKTHTYEYTRLRVFIHLRRLYGRQGNGE